MENFIITMGCLGIGVLLRRIPRFPRETGNVLNLFVIHVSLPALVLLKIPDLTFSRNLLVPIVMPWAMLLVSALGIMLVSRIFRWNRGETGCLLLLVPLGNTSFLGIPMVKAFFGEEAIPYALLYDQFGSFLALATYGSLVIALFGQNGDKPTPRGVARKIITFPPFVALLLAFMARPLPCPPVLVSLLQTLAGTLVPVVMTAVGFQLTLRLGKDAALPLCIGLGGKLIAAPALAIFACAILGLEGEAVRVSIFEAGMPPMVSAGALAILAGLSPNLTAALVGLGIILGFVTLPVLYQFL